LLLHYFGEGFEEKDCNKMCDNCAHPKPKQDVSRELIKGLQCFEALKSEFSMNHMVNFLVGNKADSSIKSYAHEGHTHFGAGKDKDKLFWKSLIRLALVNGYLNKNIEKYGLLSLNEAGKNYLKNPIAHEMAVDVEYDNVSEDDFESFKLESVCDEVLFSDLKDLRRKVAKEKDLPPYVIFQDPSLEDMAIKYPITIEELANINGVGKNKAQKFGAPFIDYIEKYVAENDIERPMDIVLKGNSEKSAKRVSIILNIDKKVDLPDIAKQLGIEFDDLIGELEQIVNTGTKLNIKYFLGQFLDEDLQDEITQYFRSVEVEDVDAAVDYFDGEFSYEELKLMHLQFVSDLAN
jgi:ATP-dependent DNA helicase RecQ